VPKPECLPEKIVWSKLNSEQKKVLFDWCREESADLSEADLRGANLRGATITITSVDAIISIIRKAL
jgi:uncharacterized protein YjbI with pentapeptide repeats